LGWSSSDQSAKRGEPQDHDNNNGAIRPFFTWGAELFNLPSMASKFEPFRRLEYQALGKITGGGTMAAATRS